MRTGEGDFSSWALTPTHRPMPSPNLGSGLFRQIFDYSEQLFSIQEEPVSHSMRLKGNEKGDVKRGTSINL